MEGHDLSPADIAEVRAFVDGARTDPGAFDVVKGDSTADAADTERPRSYGAAGATWWLESIVPWGNSLGEVRERIGSGPPRV